MKLAHSADLRSRLRHVSCAVDIASVVTLCSSCSVSLKIVKSNSSGDEPVMGAMRITSWYPNFYGSHFGMPRSYIHKMTGLGVNMV